MLFCKLEVLMAFRAGRAYVLRYLCYRGKKINKIHLLYLFKKFVLSVLTAITFGNVSLNGHAYMIIKPNLI